MELTLKDKYALIRKELLSKTGTNPLIIAREIMNKEFVSIHGPEHHYLDGASFLVAYHNKTGKLDLPKALDTLEARAINMPGAMCGYWGVCGSVSSLGACFSIINSTSPLSSDDSYKNNMEFTSLVLAKMSEVGGPRCCKRNATTSILLAVDFLKEKYGVELDKADPKCDYSHLNKQCIGTRCPYYRNK